MADFDEQFFFGLGFLGHAATSGGNIAKDDEPMNNRTVTKDANNIDVSFLSLSELTTEEKREVYFMRTGHTQESLAAIACVSAVSMNRYWRQGDMPEHRHAALVSHGIPPEILPKPVPYRLGTQPPFAAGATETPEP